MKKILSIFIISLFSVGCLQTKEQAMQVRNQEDSAELQRSIMTLSEKLEDLNKSIDKLSEKVEGSAAVSRAEESPLAYREEGMGGVSPQPLQPMPPIEIDILEEPEEPLREEPEREEPPVEELQPAAKSEGVSKEDLYQRAFDLYRKGAYAGAIAGFDAMLSAYPATDYSDNALYWKGECYYALQQFREAIAVFEEVVRKFPQENKAPDAQLKTGYAYMELKEKGNAKAAFQKVMDLYPFSDAAERAIEKLNSL